MSTDTTPRAEVIRLSVDADGIATLVIDYPAKSMNVIDQAFLDSLDACTARVAGDAAIRGAIVTSGKAAFVAGADLVTMEENLDRMENDPVEVALEKYGALSRAIRRLETCGKPVVAAINGVAYGGGFALGDVDTHDVTACEHAVSGDCVVVSIDYRLAPEHPFPAAVDDVWAATRWVSRNAAQFGADASRIAVAGDSAGGTLAAVVAQSARDRGEPRIVFQLLWYPSTMWDTTLASLTENADAPVLDHAAIAAFTEWYAGHLDLAELTDPPIALAPGRNPDLTGLPPAYIAVAGHDPLRDDGIRYAELLAAAGVDTELDNAATLVHGYLGYSGVVPAATEATARGLAALRAALHP